ncbi:hypothetical protein BD408DRAFT_463074 [Parasitella parasitica]|nr:hypothetical protein BD408DRAFT_463074 [Parasitella parasitica]
MSITPSPLSSPRPEELTTIGSPTVSNDASVNMMGSTMSTATEKLKDLDISSAEMENDSSSEELAVASEDVAMTDTPQPPATPSLKEILKKTLQKKEVARRNYLNALGQDSPEAARRADELREEVTNLEKHVKTLTAGMKVHRNLKTSTAPGLKISKRDLPKFQLESHKAKPFPSEDSYKSVDHFLSEFEKIVFSSGQAIEDVWKQLIPLTLSYDLDDWLRTVILMAATWEEVKVLFRKKFGTAHSRLNKRRAVMNMVMNDSETVDEYTGRFLRTVSEAGYNRDDLTIGDVFLLGFPEAWQFNLTTVLLARTQRESWSASEISTFAMNLIGDKTPRAWFATNRMGEDAPTTKRKPLSSDSAKTASISAPAPEMPTGRMLGHRNLPNRSSTSKSPVPCRHCGRPWRHGHTCEEYRAAKRQRGPNVLSVSTSVEEENDVDNQMNNFKNIKEEYENEAYKSCTMPEAIVRIKINDPSNCFVRQYPLSINAHAEIKVQLEQWLRDGVVERTKPNPTYHSPLLAVPKRDPLTDDIVCWAVDELSAVLMINKGQPAFKSREMLILPNKCPPAWFYNQQKYNQDRYQKVIQYRFLGNTYNNEASA